MHRTKKIRTLNSKKRIKFWVAVPCHCMRYVLRKATFQKLAAIAVVFYLPETLAICTMKPFGERDFFQSRHKIFISRQVWRFFCFWPHCFVSIARIDCVASPECRKEPSMYLLADHKIFVLTLGSLYYIHNLNVRIFRFCLTVNSFSSSVNTFSMDILV